MDRFQPRLSLSLQFPGGELVTAALRPFKDGAWRQAADEAEVAPFVRTPPMSRVFTALQPD